VPDDCKHPLEADWCLTTAIGVSHQWQNWCTEVACRVMRHLRLVKWRRPWLSTMLRSATSTKTSSCKWMGHIWSLRTRPGRQHCSTWLHAISAVKIGLLQQAAQVRPCRQQRVAEKTQRSYAARHFSDVAKRVGACSRLKGLCKISLQR
jgi:hypothetical protein